MSLMKFGATRTNQKHSVVKVLSQARRTEYEKVEFVYAHLTTGLIMNMLVGAALLTVMYGALGVGRAEWWYSCLLIVVAARFLILYFYRRCRDKLSKTRFWRIVFIAGALAMGLVWGMGGIVLFPENDVARQIFLSFIIGGMAMGAVPYLAPLLPAYVLFIFLSELPINFYLFSFPDKLHITLGVVNTLFTLTMLVAARLNQQNFVNNFKLRYANEELVRRLNETNNELEHKIYLKNKIEQDLRENESRFKSLASAAHDGVILHSGNTIIEANEAAARMSGYPLQELIGTAVIDLIAVDSREDIVSRLANPGYETFETTCLRKDGSTFQAEISPGDTTYKGNPARIVSVRDVSKQKQIEANLLHAKNAAEEADKLKSEFLASVSHELRTPLNAIIGVIQLLEQSSLNQEQRKYISMSDRASQQLLSLINDLLDLSRIETGNLPIRQQDISLNTLLYEILQIMSFRARERDDKINLSLSEDLPEYVNLDPERLKQVLLNLLGNAIKFTEHGRIELRVSLYKTTNHDSELYFEVSDNGIGIPVEKQAVVFNRFTQLDSSISRNYSGVGLGLAICKELVEKMGGQIGVASQPDEGATFWFRLPFRAAQQQAESATERHELVIDTRVLKGKKVLLVEDEETNQIIAASMLESLGCEVDVVSDGKQAVEVDRQYDFIIMDMQMPVMDGLTACQLLRSKGVMTPIIALTANASEEDMRSCLAAGMNDYLSKPINIQLLRQALTRWIAENRQSATPGR